ncbi:MAG: hypothetical protein WBE13_05720 [Candidatus Acidiferrum sp.]
MSPFLAVILCAAGVFANSSHAQDPNSGIEPLRVPAGTVLAFHLQTRLRPASGDPFDVLPQGTVLRVRILNSIDSSVDPDGTEFHASIVSDVALRDAVVVHADSEARGMLVLLRSRNHPDGFRYELLLTDLAYRGKSYPLTASLNTSFIDSGAPPAIATKVDTKQAPKPAVTTNTTNTRLPVSSSQ